jgi:multiple sugar transport system substrate-binding protein
VIVVDFVGKSTIACRCHVEEEEGMSDLLTRRTVLRTGVAGCAAIYGLSGCGSDDKGATSGGGGGGSAKASGTVSFGSNYSDPVPKKALQSALDGFSTSSGVKVAVNTVDHNTFQEQINNYLQGTPDDVFTWFAGYRMQFFAQKGLATDISDVWEKIGGNFSAAFKDASTLDGKQYFVPFYNYPWAVFYRKSVFKKHGYEPAKNLDEFKALMTKMKSDGLTPLAFGDKDGWPAMGTFDYINMRTNGYDFHKSLMAGEEAWDGEQVKQVFNTWRELLPFHQEGALGRTWQDAAVTLNKDAAMYVLGMFVGQQFEGEALKDIDFFPFPEINPEHGQDAVEAPIDGFMLSKDPKNEAAGKALLEYLGGAEAQQTYLKSDPNNVAGNDQADTSSYNALQKKAVELISGAKQISQFLDRDTRPDFASTVMIPALQQFIKTPDDVDGLTKSIEQQKKTIFV